MEQLEKTSMRVSKYVKYNHTEKGRARHRRGEQGRGCRPDYKRELYHRHQEEAGCHMDVRNFLPGYRLIKALQTAEIIEIQF